MPKKRKKKPQKKSAPRKPRADGREPRARHCIPATEQEIQFAEWALQEMETMMRKIVLVPAPIHERSGHARMIRVVEALNPVWYSRMAQARGFDQVGRKKRYGPLRQYVIKACKRIISGWKDPVGLEDEILEEYEQYYEEAMHGRHR